MLLLLLIKPIFYGIKLGHENLADLLIKKGADASITDSFGVSILDRAIENGILIINLLWNTITEYEIICADDEKLVDVLLSNGAFSVNAKTFFAAVSNGKYDFSIKVVSIHI